MYTGKGGGKHRRACVLCKLNRDGGGGGIEGPEGEGGEGGGRGETSPTHRGAHLWVHTDEPPPLPVGSLERGLRGGE